jgi:Flp pilus assembly protein TadD
MNQLPEALYQFRETLLLDPNMADAYNTLGLLYYQIGDKQQAVDQYMHALRLNPNLTAARRNLAKMGIAPP